MFPDKDLRLITIVSSTDFTLIMDDHLIVLYDFVWCSLLDGYDYSIFSLTTTVHQVPFLKRCNTYLSSLILNFIRYLEINPL